jgi:hypothetical protein
MRTTLNGRCELGLLLSRQHHEFPQTSDALQVRVGIATGIVVVGDLIGEGAAYERGVVGDAPNLAARLQALAEPGQVVIAQSTRQLAGGLFDYADLGLVAIKGLGEPVNAWCVIDESTIKSRFEARHETDLVPMIGREEQMELVLRRWRQAMTGEGRVVLLSGEPGVGKSRLVSALQKATEADSHFELRFFCSPHHQDSALYPVTSELASSAKFERNDSPDVKLAKLASLLELAKAQDGDVSLFAELLSIPAGGRFEPLQLIPQQKKKKTFEALLRRIELLAQQRAVLIIYEDVHWIDPSSRELLEAMIERAAVMPALLVITFRPEFQTPWSVHPHVATFTLNRLAREATKELIDQLAGHHSLPDQIIAEIIHRTDGVPLFVEEVTKSVVEAVASKNSGQKSQFRHRCVLH